MEHLSKPDPSHIQDSSKFHNVCALDPSQMMSVAPSSTINVSRKSAHEILEIRLARDEIELDDYRQRQNALKSSKE